MSDNFDLRHQLSKASNVDTMIEVCEQLKNRYIEYHIGHKSWSPPAG